MLTWKVWPGGDARVPLHWQEGIEHEDADADRSRGQRVRYHTSTGTSHVEHR